MVVHEGKRVRRRMHKFRIDHLACVDRPAMEPALAVLLKRDRGGGEYEGDGDEPEKGKRGQKKRGIAKSWDRLEKVLPRPKAEEKQQAFVSRFMSNDEAKREFGKREQRLAVALEAFRRARRSERVEKGHGASDAVPVMTSSENGHSHLVWLSGERGGETTHAKAPDSEQGHDHAWTVDQAGQLIVGENDGHAHVVDSESVLAAMRELMLQQTEAPESVVDVVFARSSDGAEKRSLDFQKTEDVVRDICSGAFLCKNTDGDVLGEDPAMPDGAYPIRCRADLREAIAAVDREAGEIRTEVVAHVRKRARVLGLTELLPEEGALSDPTHSGGADPMAEPEKKGDGGAGLEKKLDEANAKIEKLETRLKTADQVAELSTEHRAFYKGLDSEEDREAFLKKSDADRQKHVDETQKGDPVIYKSLDGTEYRKSVGEQLIALAKSNDELRKDLSKSNAEREFSRFEKRAKEELAGYPGTVEERVELLKAVESIEDDGARTKALEALRAGNVALSKAFVPSGGSRVAPEIVKGDSTAAEAELDRLANEMVKADTTGEMDYFDAYDRVAEKNPELAKRAIGNATPTGG